MARRAALAGLFTAALSSVMLAAPSVAPAGAPAQRRAAAAFDAAACNALTRLANVRSAVWHPVGIAVTYSDREVPPFGANSGPAPPPLPAHCEVTGALDQRVGEGGQHYAIGYRMRLPAAWNGRFLFLGGGGSDGVVGQATGAVGPGNPLALTQGYAVIAQDSGHDNAVNIDPMRGGDLVFGFDPIARRNYGHASLPRTTAMAHRLMRRVYHRDPVHSYFFGCSKGGQEGMALAQKYPRLFDGIVAAAPGFSLPKAALAEAWSVQKLAALTHAQFATDLAGSFSKAQFGLVRDAVLQTCDRDDGAADGMIGAVDKCTGARLRPAFAARTCQAGQTSVCLSSAQVNALYAVIDGPHDSSGKALYASFAWDAGIGLDGWNGWVTGNERGPARNIVLGAGSLAAVFTTPPSALSADPEAMLQWQLAFDFDRDAPRIFATGAGFAHSPWQDISARSPNLAAFAAHGGRMIVPHGTADPVFSINDTLAWWNEVDAAMHDRAASTVRVFPVPGMNHCGGGNATDRYDAFGALVEWVEKGKAPGQIIATASNATSWPGRSRPLCPWPRLAHYRGQGSLEDAASFVCEAPLR